MGASPMGGRGIRTSIAVAVSRSAPPSRLSPPLCTKARARQSRCVVGMFAVALAAAVAHAGATWTASLQWAAGVVPSAWPRGPPRGPFLLRRRAKPEGFQSTGAQGGAKTLTREEQQSILLQELSAKINEGMENLVPEEERPKYMLPGPLKPPAAPASYKALTKIWLRRAPSTLADVVTTHEIQKGGEFYVPESIYDNETGITYLRTDEEYDSGWVVDTGIAGAWAGKKIVKRVAGSLRAQKGIAVNQISPVEKAEVVEPGSDEDEKKAGTQNDSKVDVPPAIQRALDDPQIVDLCQKLGLGPDELKKNPSFVLGVAKRLYGDGPSSKGGS